MIGVFPDGGPSFPCKKEPPPTVVAFSCGEMIMAEGTVIPGIESKKKLLDFFVAKHHRNLVLHVAALKELALPIQHELISILICDAGFSRESCADAGRFWIQNSMDGYVVLPFAKLLASMEMKTVQRLQLILYLYKEVRMGKGEPSRVDACSCHHNAECKTCHGTGIITTYLEISEEEERLAEENINDPT
jgi:hypothetical protein